MARALAEGHTFLVENVSPKVEDWEWQFVHLNEYPNVPWSFTPLKNIFHRETPTGGNGNTIRVSKYSLKKVHEQKVFKGIHTPNYKQVIQFGEKPEDDITLYSQDVGQNGNLLGGHYFDMNLNHLNGELMKGYIGK